MTAVGPGPSILIPAAGASSRMRGRDKLLEPVRSRPLLADRVVVASSAIASSAGQASSADASWASARGPRVVVTLPPRDVAPGRWAALSETAARLVEVGDRATGLSASLRAGVAALPPDCPGLMILPADMPDITADDIADLLEAFDGRSVFRGASANGKPGHPVLFPAADLPALAEVTGDQGGREVLARAAARVRLIALPADHALTDLDTPEDWAVWRARQT